MPTNNKMPLKTVTPLVGVNVAAVVHMAVAVLLTSISLQSFNTVNALDNGLARTPPMGWLAWKRHTCGIDSDKYPDSCINANLFKSMADELVRLKLVDQGYTYLNIDNCCWSELERALSKNKLVPHSQRFASGIKDVADYIHSLGLRLGIYGDCSTATCAGYPAQLKPNNDSHYFELDARTFADWGIDSLKFDGCNAAEQDSERRCLGFARALNQTNRQILVTCEWPFYMLHRNLLVNWTLAIESCNVIRFWEDVEDSWASVLWIVDFAIKLQSTIVKYHGPGHWFDPDVLILGNFGLSADQEQAQMALWSVWSAPLLVSNDLRNLREQSLSLLTNRNLIDVNQDKLGVWGMLVAQNKDGLQQAFVKPMLPIKGACPSFAIVYLHREALGDTKELSFKVKDLLSAKGELIEVAAERAKRIGIELEAAKCLDAIKNGKLSLSNNNDDGFGVDNFLRGVLSQPERKTPTFKVLDLLALSSRPVPIGQVELDEKLSLRVNPSGGARAVKLELV